MRQSRQQTQTRTIHQNRLEHKNQFQNHSVHPPQSQNITHLNPQRQTKHTSKTSQCQRHQIKTVTTQKNALQKTEKNIFSNQIRTAIINQTIWRKKHEKQHCNLKSCSCRKDKRSEQYE